MELRARRRDGQIVVVGPLGLERAHAAHRGALGGDRDASDLALVAGGVGTIRVVARAHAAPASADDAGGRVGAGEFAGRCTD